MQQQKLQQEHHQQPQKQQQLHQPQEHLQLRSMSLPPAGPGIPLTRPCAWPVQDEDEDDEEHTGYAPDPFHGFSEGGEAQAAPWVAAGIGNGIGPHSLDVMESSPETSADNRAGGGGGGGALALVNSGAGGASSSEQDPKSLDPKSARRLAQNREAARKSRLRKKAYVQQLESSRIRLQQMEQELARMKSQQHQMGLPSSSSEHQPLSLGGGGGPAGTAALSGTAPGLPSASSGGVNANPGAAAFDLEYARWLEEHHRLMCDLRAALQSRLADPDLRVLVESVVAHYDELFRIKGVAAKADVFHLISGMWKTPAERCFLWMGGFRPSELLKVLIPQIEPLTEQQLLGICSLQQSSQQAEDALSQGMEALQQSLADTLSAGSLGAASNVANYMGQMAMAMGKLGTLESFVKQADSLRQQTLQQMHRILTTRQAARGLLAMGDYFARLRALSSLWAARPRDQ